MATIDQPLSTRGQRYDEDQPNVLNSLFARVYTLNWETIIYIVIFGLALFTRFYELGARVISHDESLHTLYSYNLYKDGNFEHSPLMHGPILFHFTAFFYFLFGPNDFSARIYAAILGVLIVMYPLLFRRWLGRWGAILASLMMLISPLMMFYSRYIREDMPAIIASITMAYAILMYLSGPENQRRRPYWLYLLSAAMLWNLGSKETAFIYIAVFGLFGTIYWLVRVAQYYFNLPGKPIFYTIMIGFLLAVVAALGMICVVSVSLGSNETSNTIGTLLGLPAQSDGSYIITMSDRVDFLTNQLNAMLSGRVVTNDFVAFLSWTGLVVTAIMGLTVGTALWAYKSGRTSFTIPDLLAVPVTLITLVVVGTATTLGIGLIFAISLALVYAAIRLHGESFSASVLYVGATTAILVGYWILESRNLLPPSGIEGAAQFDRAALLTIALLAIIGAGMAFLFTQSNGIGGFGRQLILILAIALVLCLGFLIIEELSFEPARARETAEQPVPGEESIEAVEESKFSLLPIGLVWVFSILAVGGIFYAKQRGVDKELERFPEFDVLIIMGTLVLPWITAIFVFITRGQAADYIAVAEGLPVWLRDFIPVGEVAAGQETLRMIGESF